MAGEGRKYRFDDRSRYGKGILSSVVSAMSILIFLSATFICMTTGGKTPEWIGVAGFAGFLSGLYGMIAGLESFRERNQSYTLSRAGTLMGGFMVAVWFIVFCIGMAG